MQKLVDPSFWVCAVSQSLYLGQIDMLLGQYCNRQHDLGSDLGSNPDDSSFRRAMLLAENVLVIMDPAGERAQNTTIEHCYR